MLITVRSLTIYALLGIVLRTLFEPTIKLVYYMTSHQDVLVHFARTNLSSIRVSKKFCFERLIIK